MFQAYLFDLDGTLLDSEKLWVEVVAGFIRARGGTISDAGAMALVYGRSWREIHAEICRDHPGLHMPIEEMEALMRPDYQRLERVRDIRIHGSIDLLKRLSGTAPVCIVSGSSRRQIHDAVTRMGIDDHLVFFLGAEDYSPGKPDPACYRLAARKLGVAPEGCLVFEDSQAGVRAAKLAGMRVVALARPAAPKQDFSEADRVVADLDGFDPAQMNTTGPR